MNTILLLILILLLIGALPAWPYSRGWGYYPSGGLGLILVIVIVASLSSAICEQSDNRRMGDTRFSSLKSFKREGMSRLRAKAR